MQDRCQRAVKQTPRRYRPKLIIVRTSVRIAVTLILVTGKISMFGSLAQRGIVGGEESLTSRPKQRTRHVFVAMRVQDEILERPGVLLDWAREPRGWIARVAYVADEEGTLIVAWFDSEQLTPVPQV